MTNEELIKKSSKLIKRHLVKDRLLGDVSAVVVSASGAEYVGVCLDLPGVGICAERAAVITMVSAGEYKIKKVVATWIDERDGKLYVLPPCGICRQFMRAVDEANLDTDVILSKDSQEKLRDLLPYNEWPQPTDL